jgi:hypothetical protein
MCSQINNYTSENGVYTIQELALHVCVLSSYHSLELHNLKGIDMTPHEFCYASKEKTNHNNYNY